MGSPPPAKAPPQTLELNTHALCQGVGTFLVDPVVSFSGTIAGSKTAVRLTFTLYLPLQTGDTLQLQLGGFGGSDVVSFAVSTPNSKPKPETPSPNPHPRDQKP